MIKKTITFEDFDGNKRTEDFYFHYKKNELADMQMTVAGGFVKKVEAIIAAQTLHEMVPMWKELILGSYGVKSPDGRQFIKNKEIRDSFEQTEAFSILYMELVTNTEAAIEFVNGIMPKDLPKAE